MNDIAREPFTDWVSWQEEVGCRCGGSCATCVDAIGHDVEIHCPCCPVHGGADDPAQAWDDDRNARPLP